MENIPSEINQDDMLALKRFRPRTPYLMLAADDNNDYREFYSLFEEEIVGSVFLPEARGKKCMECFPGWFMIIGQEGEMSLFNPASRTQIDLPHQKTTGDYKNQRTIYPWHFIGKAVLSSSPSENPKDFVLMVMDGGQRFLSFWRPGDDLWTRITTYNAAHADVVYHKGHFYSIDVAANVVVCDLAGPNPATTRIVAKLPPEFHTSGGIYYIVESLGSLLIVGRVVDLKPQQQPEGTEPRYEISTPLGRFLYGTLGFRVLELDPVRGNWTHLKDLGDRALFLGHSASLSIDKASSFPGIKANHIYFTDDNAEFYGLAEDGGGRDTGVFNLANGTISRHYEDLSLSRICPPIWFVPNFS